MLNINEMQFIENMNLPPTVLSILKSFNYGHDIKTINLSEEYHDKIFDFNYPISEDINKNEFEINILNHFLTRRIGFDTVGLFKIKLQTKLREIMPTYNILFKSIKNWDLFDDGGKVTTIKDVDGFENKTTQNRTESSFENSGSNQNKYSDTPQNNLQNVQQDYYLSDYTNNIANTSGEGESTSNILDSGTRGEVTQESVVKTPDNKVQLYKEFIESKQNIYSMLFLELDCLFFGLL